MNPSPQQRIQAGNFTERGLRWVVGVVALPQVLAKWPPAKAVITGKYQQDRTATEMAPKAGNPPRQGPGVNP